MTTIQLALGSLSLCLLQGCVSRSPDPVHHLSQNQSEISGGQGECPPLFGKVCYGSVSGAMKCGCSTVSPLGAPYN